MTTVGLPLHILIPAVMLFLDTIVAATLFLVLRRRESPLAFVIPPAVLISGVAAAVMFYFTLSPRPI